MTIAKLHIMRRLLLNAIGALQSLVSEIEQELRANGALRDQTIKARDYQQH